MLIATQLSLSLISVEQAMEESELFLKETVFACMEWTFSSDIKKKKIARGG